MAVEIQLGRTAPPSLNGEPPSFQRRAVSSEPANALTPAPEKGNPWPWRPTLTQEAAPATEVSPAFFNGQLLSKDVASQQTFASRVPVSHLRGDKRFAQQVLASARGKLMEGMYAQFAADNSYPQRPSTYVSTLTQHRGGYTSEFKALQIAFPQDATAEKAAWEAYKNASHNPGEIKGIVARVLGNLDSRTAARWKPLLQEMYLQGAATMETPPAGQAQRPKPESAAIIPLRRSSRGEYYQAPSGEEAAAD